MANGSIISDEKNAVILLLADLQFGQSIYSKEGALRNPEDEARKAAADLIADLKRHKNEGIPSPNIIVLAGDLIHANPTYTIGRDCKDSHAVREKCTGKCYHEVKVEIDQAKSYKAVSVFIDTVSKKLKLKDVAPEKKQRIIAVPGNHEEERPNNKFEAYSKFCNDCALTPVITKVINVQSAETPINFVCFNSAAGNFLNMFSSARAKRNSLNIALWHHHPDGGINGIKGWNQAHTETLNKSFDILLHGHTHKFDAEKVITGSSQKGCWRIGCGSFIGHDKDRKGLTRERGPALNNYLIIEINSRADYFCMYSRMYEPYLKKWVPHFAFKEGTQDRRAYQINGDNEITFPREVILLGEENICSYIDLQKQNCSRIAFYGKRTETNIYFDKIRHNKNLQIHDVERCSNALFNSTRQKIEFNYLPLRTADCLIEFHKKFHDGQSSLIIFNGMSPNYAYAYSDKTLSSFFVSSPIELKHHKQLDQIKALKDHFDKMAQHWVTEWKEGYYHPPFPPAIQVSEYNDWQEDIFTSYVEHGKNLINRSNRILITWDLEFKKIKSLIYIEKLKDFITALNKQSRKAKRILFIDDDNFFKKINLHNTAFSNTLKQELQAYCNDSEECYFAVMLAHILKTKILDGFDGVHRFVSRKAINSTPSMADEIKDIAFYFKRRGLKEVQDSKLIDVTIGKRSDDQILKVYFRKPSDTDPDKSQFYDSFFEKQSFAKMIKPIDVAMDYKNVVFKKFGKLFQEKAAAHQDKEKISNILKESFGDL